MRFSEEKNQLLKAIRGISFDEILTAIRDGGVLADMTHPHVACSHHRLCAVQVGKYVYAVPYVINTEKKELFLKTVYPSRVLTKRYLH